MTEFASTTTPGSAFAVPVVLFIFNRPDLTARVLDVVADVRPQRLLVVADGPRADHPHDHGLVRASRAVIERVDWPCDLLTCYSDVNLGCDARFASGLSWVFSTVDEAIILEDDCVPDPSFFRYCEELLDRYRDDERVQMVSGVSVAEAARFSPCSYYFSRCYHIWGWATWSRAWRHYDPDMRDWPALRETGWLERQLGNETAALIMRGLFEQTYGGGVPQWDLKWVFSGWKRNALSIIPHVNLVTNIGFGAGATHLQDPHHPHANLPTSSMPFPLRHPPDVAVLDDADNAEWETVFPQHIRSEPHWLRRKAEGALRRGKAALARR